MSSTLSKSSTARSSSKRSSKPDRGGDSRPRPTARIVFLRPSHGLLILLADVSFSTAQSLAVTLATFPISSRPIHCCAFLFREEFMAVGRALISVFDKTGIVEFAKRLAGLEIEILSTGGTSKLLREAGVTVRDV